MTIRLVSAVSVFFLICSGFLVFHSTAQVPTLPIPLFDSLRLDQGYLEAAGSQLNLKLVRSSQTVAGLAAKTDDSFDFTPADRLNKRAANGFHHLGDLILRLRLANSTQWKDYDTSADRKPIKPEPTQPGAIAIADLSPTLPADIPVIARLLIQQPAKLPSVGTYQPTRSFIKERNAFTIRLSQGTTSLELSDR